MFPNAYSLRSLALGLIAPVVLAACSGGHDDDPAVTPGTPSVDPNSIDVSQAEYCDLTQPSECLLPFPNNFYTRPDPDTGTGLRVDLDTRAIPTNDNNDPFDTAEVNRNDGFSPGPMLVAHVPGVDLELTGAVPITDIEQSLNTAAPVQLIHAGTGERQLIWAELDARAEDDDKQALIIRVAKNLVEGERYIVVLQNLVDSAGAAIPPSPAFQVYRDAIDSTVPELEARRADFEALFAALASAGIQREDLYLSWEFTVGSTENISGRILHMRDTAIAELAGAAPAFVLDTVEDRTTLEDPNWARWITGTLTVPNFLNTPDGATGSTLNYLDSDPDALPAQLGGDGTVSVPFDCGIPHAAFDDAMDTVVDTRAVMIGHGLFGSRGTVDQFAPMAQEQNLVLCGMDWWGMSSADIGTAAATLANLSLFPTFPDRLQQAFLNKILLSEAIVNAAGFGANAAFQDAGGTILFKAGEVHFDGSSQGAVLGGALTAVNPRFERTVLDVAATNFSLLLRRSSAWATYGAIFNPAYPDELVRPLMLSLVQMLWDRGENNGYLNHLTEDPLPGSTNSQILIHVGLGDQTVTETGAEVLARSTGALRHGPTVVEGRHIAVNPYVGIDTITTYPHEGSGLIVWDSGPFPIAGHPGTPLQSPTNEPEDQGYNTHGMPFVQRPARDQKAEFWRTGLITNVCGTEPCYGDGYDGTPGVFMP